MKIIASLSPLDRSECQNVEIRVKSGGHMLEADTYLAGTLYLREHHVEPLLRTLEGASGAHLDLEVHRA